MAYGDSADSMVRKGIMKKHPFEESILDMPVEDLAAEIWQKTEDGSYELTENA